MNQSSGTRLSNMQRARDYHCPSRLRCSDAGRTTGAKPVGLLCVALMLMFVGMACDDPEPVAPDFRDIGTDGQVLLPPPPSWTIAGVVDGQAEWPPFREPETIPSRLPGEMEAQDAAAEAPPFDPAAVEADIRAMLGEYNEIAADATIDELLDYYVEEQHDTLRTLLQTAMSLRDIYAGLREELGARLPDAADRIGAALSALGADELITLDIETITVTDENTASGKPEEGFLPLSPRFRRVDGEWYIELSVDDVEIVAMLKPAFDFAVQAYQAMLDGLRADQMPAEAVLSQLETAAQERKALRGGLVVPVPQQPEEEQNIPDEAMPEDE